MQGIDAQFTAQKFSIRSSEETAHGTGVAKYCMFNITGTASLRTTANFPKVQMLLWICGHWNLLPNLTRSALRRLPSDDH